MREKVIVIGAGMGGLSAAIRLQLAGYNVEIYEKNQTPGGKMSQIKAEGYTFGKRPITRYLSNHSFLQYTVIKNKLEDFLCHNLSSH